MYDHLGGGFSRYSVDERWLVPHFEKMLYDNALLIELMTEVWKETQSDRLHARISETIAWLSRTMLVPGGGFASSYDADSEGEEGRFYLWTAQEITNVLGHGEEAALFSQVYDVAEGGNWEGKTILNRLNALALLSHNEERTLDECRRKLLQERNKRKKPSWDDKVLADWNGLAIRALARAGDTFVRPEWIKLAEALIPCLRPDVLRGPSLSLIPRGQAQRPRDVSRLCEHHFGGPCALPGHEREALSRRRRRLDSDHEPAL